MFKHDNKTKLFTILTLLIISSIIILPNIPSSYAHAFVVKSDPSPSQSLSIPPTKVDVYFSDPVDIKYSQLKVLDSDGKQIQIGDQQYINNDQSTLSVALSPNIKNGIYTVSTKVLDQTDGHVTENAFVFGVGQEVPQNLSTTSNNYQEVSIPEAVARFPSLVGQVIVTGIVASTLWLWEPINKISRLKDVLSQPRLNIENSMIKLSIIGSIVILVANFAMIVVQAYSINAGILDAINTKFGNMWVLRMILSSALFGLSFVTYYKAKKKPMILSKAYLLALLGVSFSVLLTTSLISHGAATGKIVPILLDFFHNVFASLWIGGVIYIAFIVMPHLKQITSTNQSLSTISLLIPRFSTLVIAVLGAVTITGPFLLYTIEGNLSLTLASFYGKILIVKLSLAAAMISLGAYNQMFISNKAYLTISNKNNIESKTTLTKSILDNFGKSIKIEAFIGIALIASVAILVDSGLPSSEFQNQLQSIQNNVFAMTSDSSISQEFTQTRFVENGSRIVLTMNPFSTGSNSFSMTFLDSAKNPIDMKSVQLKLTQTDSGIGPITIDTNKSSTGTFTTNTDFGFPGHWTVRVEGEQNKENSLNLVASYNLFVKPKLDNLQLDIKEYKTPTNNSAPRYPVYDSVRNKIWVGDTSLKSGKILDFDLGTNKYTEHKINGLYGVIYSALDSHDTLWYIDYQRKILGNYNPDDNSNKEYTIPNKGILTGIAIDSNDTVWIMSNTNDLLKFDIKTGKFDSIKLPYESDPLGIAIDNTQGKIWLAEGVGKISSVNISDGKVTEFSPEGNYTMKDPTGITIDSQTGKIYISEHSGNAVSVFDPLLKTFKKIQLDPDKDNLPYGMAFDKYHNLWVAQHTIDKISIIDTRTGQIIEKNLPSSNTWTQWITSDAQGNIILAEERANAIATITITAGPTQSIQSTSQDTIPSFDYAQIVAPSITGLLVIVGFFYSKSIVELRKASNQIKKIQEF